MLVEPNELAEEGKFYLERMDKPQAFHAVRPTLEEIYKFPSVTASGVPSGSMETTSHLEFESVERFSGEIAKVRDELDKVSEGHEVFVVCETDAEIERLGELFKNSAGSEALAELARKWHQKMGELRGPVRVAFCAWTFGGRFRIVPQQVVLVSAAELFQRQDLARTTGGGRRGRSIVFGVARATWLCMCAWDWPVSRAAVAREGGAGGGASRAEYNGGTKIMCRRSG
jgi:transcription-repair coupling factor (superfamily II helicase)